MTAAPKLSDIAARIRTHLVRFESDPKINAPDVVYKTSPYYNANSWVGGSRVGVRYVSYHGDSFISKADAMKYLAWLDAGNVGRHYEALKDQR